jgi:chromosome segregation ATPase
VIPMSFPRWQSKRLAAALSVCVALSGCASASNGPASERGFFGGIGAMVSGADEKRAAGLEQTATDAERKKQQLQARLAAANEDAARTREQVQVAERRLAAIHIDLQRQKERLATLRASGGSSSAPAEVTRLQNEIEAIERERRAAQDATSTVTPATLRSLEERTRAVGNALDHLGAI